MVFKHYEGASWEKDQIKTQPPSNTSELPPQIGVSSTRYLSLPAETCVLLKFQPYYIENYIKRLTMASTAKHKAPIPFIP